MSPFKLRRDFGFPTVFTVLLSTLLTWVPVETRAESMASTAFEQFLKQSGLASPDDILWSEVPCNQALCVQAGLQGISRGAALRQFSQIAAGFGYGADVFLVRLTTTDGDHNRVDIEVQFQTDASRVGSDKAGQRAHDVVAFLNVVSGLSPRQTTPFDPTRVSSNATVFFLYEVSWNAASRVIRGTLLAPPGAVAKKPAIAKADCTKTTIELDGKTNKPPFAKWNRLRLRWQRVCEGTQGRIQ